MLNYILSLVFCLLLMLFGDRTQGAPRPAPHDFSVEDMLWIGDLGEGRFSPDGRKLIIYSFAGAEASAPVSLASSVSKTASERDMTPHKNTV